MLKSPYYETRQLYIHEGWQELEEKTPLININNRGNYSLSDNYSLTLYPESKY